MKTQIKHLVFDMGGVLVQIDWHGQMSKLLGEDIPFEEMHQRWANSPAATAFEEGEIEFDTFRKQLMDENNLVVTPEEFEHCYRNIVQDDFPGIVEMLEKLKPNYTLSLLSNTNVLHLDMLVKRNSFLPLLDNPFTSIEFGVMKPHVEIYQKLITALNCQPQEILFFDDGDKNVLVARELGLNAERVFGPDDIKATFAKYGIQYGE
ncbi:HAD family hydrolase [Vibrio sp. WJH972]